MKYWIRTIAAIAICMHAVSFAGAAEWTELFNGKDLDGWVQRGGEAEYTVEDGCLVGRTVLDTMNSFLCTEKSYDDFVLEVEFKVDPKLNSGVQIRSEYTTEKKPATDSQGEPVSNSKGQKITLRADRVYGYQVEIDPTPRAYTGGIFDEARRGWLQHLGENPAAQKAFKENDWNKLRVEARGPSIKTWINDVAAADLTDDVTSTGFIGLQVHGVGNDKTKEGIEVRFRNIRLQDLNGKTAVRGK